VEELVDSHVHDNMMVLSSAQKKQKLLDYGGGKTTLSEKDAIRISHMNRLPKMYGVWYARTRKNLTKTLANQKSSNRSANNHNKRKRMRLIINKNPGRFDELDLPKLVMETSIVLLIYLIAPPLLFLFVCVSVCVCFSVCVFVCVVYVCLDRSICYSVMERTQIQLKASLYLLI
jgi:hypothetical protein